MEHKKNQDSDPSKESSSSIRNPSTLNDNGSGLVSVNASAVQTGGRDMASSRTVPLISSSALDLIKRKLQDASAPVTSSLLPSSVPALTELSSPGVADATAKGQQSESSKDKIKDTNGDANVSESSSDSDDEDSGPTKEECVIQFKVIFLVFVSCQYYYYYDYSVDIKLYTLKSVNSVVLDTISANTMSFVYALFISKKVKK